MKRERILVIEDEPDILEVISYNLEREGFRVETALDGAQGLFMARKSAPDLVVLDLMLPGMDGLEVCRSFKGDPLTRDIAVIMVTAKSDESDVVVGLELGADDYITKPFRPKELTARVKAILRRGSLRGQASAPERVVHDDLVVDATGHRVFIGDRELILTPTEFRLLRVLASNPGRVFDRESLISRAITDQALVGPRNIDVHIRAIRRKLGERRDILETIRGVGYRFNANASRAPL